jgi:GTP cyclohydrolase II
MTFPPLPVMQSFTWIERALEDIASGLPILFQNQEKILFIMALERFSPSWDDWLEERGAEIWYAVQTDGHVTQSPLYKCTFNKNAETVLTHLSQGKGLLENSTPCDDEDKYFIRDLFYQAELMPAGVVASISKELCLELKKSLGLTLISREMIEESYSFEGLTVEKIAEAHLPLDHSEKNTLCAFRSHPDGKDHYALVIGNPLDKKDSPPLVRVHAECFTGDLLGSLKCDCGPQLKNTILRMSESGGGILIYLRQEGRGIGLTNKLRAYALQDQGFDTVDANLKLGFAMDQRNFKTAADILKSMGIYKINLLTNNPLKMDSLSAFGIEVTGRTSLIVGINPHNEKYLKVKQTRAGHLSS